jgi:hypothetical protein
MKRRCRLTRRPVSYDDAAIEGVTCEKSPQHAKYGSRRPGPARHIDARKLARCEDIAKNESRLVVPVIVLVGTNGRDNVLGKLGGHVARRGVIADGVHVRCHVGAVDSHAADVGGLLPYNLGQMAPRMKDGLVKLVRVRRIVRGLLTPEGVEIRLSLVEGFSDTSSCVVGVTRDGIEVLALTLGDEMLKLARGSSLLGTGCAVFAPLEVGGTVVGTSTVVMPDDSVLVVFAGRERGLNVSGHVGHAIVGSRRGSWRGVDFGRRSRRRNVSLRSGWCWGWDVSLSSSWSWWWNVNLGTRRRRLVRRRRWRGNIGRRGRRRGRRLVSRLRGRRWWRRSVSGLRSGSRGGGVDMSNAGRGSGARGGLGLVGGIAMSAINQVCGERLGPVWFAVLVDDDTDIDFDRCNDLLDGLQGAPVEGTCKDTHGQGRSEEHRGAHIEVLMLGSRITGYWFWINYINS